MFAVLTSMHRLAGIASASPHKLAGRFLSPAHSNPPSAKRCVSAVRGLSLWLRSVAVRKAGAGGAVAGCAMHCLLALSLALGATCASAQTSGIPAAQDISIDVPVGNLTYIFQENDFAFKDADGSTATRSEFGVELITLPDRGILIRRNGGLIRIDGTRLFAPTFDADSGNNLFWVPPSDAISAAPGYASFAYRGVAFSDVNAISSHGTVTINLVIDETSQVAATGVPAVTGGTGASYGINAPLTASIYGVADDNGIDTSTLSWRWEEADIPATGTSVAREDAYGDIAGAATTGGITSGFTPRAAHVGKYIRVCASFKDQHPTPKDEKRCNVGVPVVNPSSGSSLRLRLRLFLEGPLR